MELTLTIERPDTPEVQDVLGELDAYYRALYPDESMQGYYTFDLCVPWITFFVLRCNSSVVGCGALSTDASYGELKRIYVRPSHRCRGWGRHLVSQICAYAREHNIAVVRLNTGIYQPEALHLYESMGFQQIKSFGLYEPDPFNVFYELRLDQ